MYNINETNKKKSMHLLRTLQRSFRTIAWVVSLLFMLHLLPRLAIQLQHTEGATWICYFISITICLIVICISVFKLNEILAKKIQSMR